jgi:hypothetical protein
MGENLDKIIQQGMPGSQEEGHPAAPPEPDAARVRKLREEREEAAEPKPASEEVDLAEGLEKAIEAPDSGREEGT